MSKDPENKVSLTLCAEGVPLGRGRRLDSQEKNH